MSIDYGDRMERVRRIMGRRGVDAVLLSVGSDLPYFTGYRAMPLERLTMAVIPAAGTPTLVVPALEAPRVVARPGVFTLQPWAETDDAVAMVADLVGEPARCAVGDETWAGFLLGLQRALPGTAFEPAGPLTAELRMRKEPEEVEYLRRAAAAADRVVARLGAERFGGRTEREVARRVVELTHDGGQHDPTFAIVASGPNAASPHHEPGDRQIRPGDAVVVDFGGTVHGYKSDTTRTFHVGPPGADFAEAFGVLRRAQDAAAASVRPGVPAAAVDEAARAVIAAAGYGEFFIHRTGHGIGLDLHEFPYIVAGNGLRLEEGMVFSVEPGIYVPDRFGMRIEDIVVVTASGSERLNRADRDLILVD